MRAEDGVVATGVVRQEHGVVETGARSVCGQPRYERREA